MTDFVTWAERELHYAGLFDKDADYGGMLAEQVLKLCKTFSNGGHSGFTAYATLEIFTQLATWRALTPLTDSSNEWMHIEESMAGNATTWQSLRQPSCFSTDGGRTFYNIDEKMSMWRQVLRRLTHRRCAKMHKTINAKTR